MASAPVCDVCQSLLVRPDESIKDAYTVEYDYPTVYASMEAGCRICTILWELTRHPDPFPMKAFLMDIGEGNLIISVRLPDGAVVDRTSPYRSHYIILRSRPTPLEDSDHSDNSVGDIYHHSCRPVALEDFPTSTGDDKCFDTMRAWLQRCSTEHTQCRKSQPGQEMQLPSRLIYIGDDEPRLVTTAEMGARRSEVRYATLSHRWDDASSHTRLLRSNSELLTRRIDLKSLPLVFQEALIAAKRLGIVYIFIDALCIIQADREDWEKEASRMGQVYENSICNFGASAAADEKASRAVHQKYRGTDFVSSPIGLFVKRTPHHVFQPIITVARKEYPYRQFIVKSWDMSAILEHQALMQRGWVFQERLLSPRSIYFGRQLTWECLESLASETFPNGVPSTKEERTVWWYSYGKPMRLRSFLRQYTLPLGDRSGVYDHWMSVVKKYSCCKLTYQTDIFPALSGLAKAFQEVLQDQYIAGMWRGNLVPQLLWTVRLGARAVKTTASPEYIAPSWSWASACNLYFPVSLISDETFSDIFTSIAEVLEAEVTLFGSDPTGRISGARLRLSGHMRPTYSGRKNPFGDSYDHQHEDNDDPVARGVTFHFLMGYKRQDREIFGLILQPTKTEHQFQRVGMFRHPRFFGDGVFVRDPPDDANEFPEFADFDPDNFERHIVTII